MPELILMSGREGWIEKSMGRGKGGLGFLPAKGLAHLNSLALLVNH